MAMRNMLRLLVACLLILFLVGFLPIFFWQTYLRAPSAWCPRTRYSSTRDSSTKKDNTWRPLLVDVTEKNLMGWSAKNYLYPTGNWSLPYVSDRGYKHNTTHKILWYTSPFWLPVKLLNKHTQTCFFNNCEHTGDRGLWNKSSAIVYFIHNKLPMVPPYRPPNQVWIYYRAEPPPIYDQFYRGNHPYWENSFNWSFTFMLDSDIVLPIGYLKTREFVPQRNYSEVFHKKTKWAAWIVSNCKTPSMRNIFVDKLKEQGLPIDIYGRCGNGRIKDPQELINNNYRFYLAFENSMCKDYVTEKFFKYFNYDTIIVVRGGADYKKLLPHNTFIDTADFNSFKEITNYLKYIGNDETLYTDFLRRKDKYVAIWDKKDKSLPHCALCAKLNNADSYEKTYVGSISRDLERCYKPGDIDILDRD